jgi:hypothetical protein
VIVASARHGTFGPSSVDDSSGSCRLPGQPHCPRAGSNCRPSDFQLTIVPESNPSSLLGSTGAISQTSLRPIALPSPLPSNGGCDVDALWRPAFPGSALVEAAADLLPSIEEAAGRDAVLGEGPRWEIAVSPGVIRVRTRDYAKAERTHERQLRRHRAEVDMVAVWLAKGEQLPELLPTRGTIYAWSPRSRARLVARLSDLDYTRLYGRYKICDACGTEYGDLLDRCPTCRSTQATMVDRSNRLPAMLTLTYPGDWLTVAPTAEALPRPGRITRRGGGVNGGACALAQRRRRRR